MMSSTDVGRLTAIALDDDASADVTIPRRPDFVVESSHTAAVGRLNQVVT